ncbi:hypothetical protein ACQ4PT_070292 [Festuca glaucescens]
MDLGLGASRPAVESVVIDDHALNIGVDEVLDPVMDEKVSSAVHDALALGMDLSPGLSFAKKAECNEEWTLVSPSKRTVQMGMQAIRAAHKPKSAVRVGASSRKKLQFSTIEKYLACRGYKYPTTSDEILDLQQMGYSLSDAEKRILSPSPAVHWTTSEPRISFASTVPFQFPESSQMAPQVIHSTTSEPRIQFSTNAPLQSSTINDTNLIMEKSPIDQYIDWHRDDPLKERTLVYAVFPSAQVVPRDVVFGHYANVGGNHQSWTAVCYVLTADFADAMPADEDQMPVDGNPHPLPGPVLDELVKPPTKRAKTQTKKLKGKKSPMQHEHDSKEPKPPQTPIHVLQAVGISLGIDPSKLTMEQLTTTPVMAKKSQVSDD